MNAVAAIDQGAAPAVVQTDADTSDEEITWDAFQNVPMDAALFLRLLSVCDFRAAEAVVLWDLLVFHRNSGLQGFAVRSGMEYPTTYDGCVSLRSCQRAIQSLSEQGLIEQAPVVRNVSRKFRMNWANVWAALSQVSPLVPGLGSVPALMEA